MSDPETGRDELVLKMREAAILSMEAVYAVVIGLAITESMSQFFSGGVQTIQFNSALPGLLGEGMRRLAHVPAVLAFALTVIPFFHGSACVLRAKYLFSLLDTARQRPDGRRVP